MDFRIVKKKKKKKPEGHWHSYCRHRILSSHKTSMEVQYVSQRQAAVLKLEASAVPVPRYRPPLKSLL